MHKHKWQVLKSKRDALHKIKRDRKRKNLKKHGKTQLDIITALAQARNLI